jgi:hypothetical protein
MNYGNIGEVMRAYHIRVVEIPRSSHLSEAVLIVSIEVHDADQTVPTVLNVIMVPRKVAGFG